MKTILYSQIVQEVQKLTSACSRIDGACLDMLKNSAKNESNPNAKFALDMLCQAVFCTVDSLVARRTPLDAEAFMHQLQALFLTVQQI